MHETLSAADLALLEQLRRLTPAARAVVADVVRRAEAGEPIPTAAEVLRELDG